MLETLKSGTVTVVLAGVNVSGAGSLGGTSGFAIPTLYL